MSLEISRRSFLAGVGAATTGLALGIRIGGATAASSKVFAPNPFIQIGNDGLVSIWCSRSEMGQGIRSSLPVLIADELGADPAKIEVVQADGDEKWGDQDTDGSASIRMLFDDMRHTAAAARQMLVAAAAARWHVPATRLSAHDDAVHDGARALSFGELAEDAAKLPVPAKAALRPRAELHHVGAELPLRDAPDQVTGRAIYGADVSLPGMLVAVISRPPALFGKASKIDDAKARAIAGVRDVIELPAPKPPIKYQALGGVAVLADHTWAAMRGRAALDVTWDGGPNVDYDSASYEQALLAAVRAPGTTVRKLGDAEAALASAATRVEAEYTVPHLVHAAMEPPAALARFDGKKCEIWACTQSPQDLRDEVATALGVAKTEVTVHVTLLGGGFGRKSFPDFAVEAALLAKRSGKPVRVQWTRDDDIRHGTMHTVSAQALAAGLDAHGKLVAWRHRIAYPTISSTFSATETHPSDGELGQGITDLPLSAANVLVETGAAPAKIRIGWMRSVCNIHQAFAVQSFIAELAHATKRDPRDMLVEVLGPARVLTAKLQGIKELGNYGSTEQNRPHDVGRLHRVIDKVTQMAGWDHARASGRILGLAAHRSFTTDVAVVVSAVRGPRGEPHIDEAWIAADAGLVVNPDRVRAQLEGAVVFGLSIAMHGSITVKRGQVEQTNYHDYRVARMPEAPRAIHVELMTNDNPPGGVGEPGVPPVAPAIANAIFELTGERHRALPIVRPS